MSFLVPNSVITMFGARGLEQWIVGIFAVVIFFPYKALKPFMALVYVLEYAGRVALPLFTPGVLTIHTPPGHAADAVLFPLTVIMFLFFLYFKEKTESLVFLMQQIFHIQIDGEISLC